MVKRSSNEFNIFIFFFVYPETNEKTEKKCNIRVPLIAYYILIHSTFDYDGGGKIKLRKRRRRNLRLNLRKNFVVSFFMVSGFLFLFLKFNFFYVPLSCHFSGIPNCREERLSIVALFSFNNS